MHDLLTHGFSDRQVPETEIIRYFTSQRCVAQMWTNTDAWNMQSFHQNEVNRSSSVRVLTMEAEMHNKFKKKNRNRHIPETQLKCHLAIIIIINTLKFIVHVQCMSLVLFVYLFAKSIIRRRWGVPLPVYGFLCEMLSTDVFKQWNPYTLSQKMLKI